MRFLCSLALAGCPFSANPLFALIMDEPVFLSSPPATRTRSPLPVIQPPLVSTATHAYPGAAGLSGDAPAPSQAEDLSPPALSGSNLSSPLPPENPSHSIAYRAQLSHYGYASDPYMDSYTKKGLGNSNNQLLPGIVAIDPESRQRYGIKNGDIVSFTLDDGTTYAGYVGDTTARGLGPRFDVYDPSGNQVTSHDGQQGTLRVEVNAQKPLTGKILDHTGPEMLRQFIDTQAYGRGD